MKVLIITSEPLNPENTLSSIFELAQAKILASEFEIGIISGRVGNSFSAVLKKLTRNIFSKERGKIFLHAKEIFSVCFLNKKIINKFSIDGISVYEGVGYDIKTPKKFKNTLSSWVKIGYHTYIEYSKDFGTPHLIHAHGRFLSAGALALEIKRKQGIKFIYTEHSTYYRRGIAPEASKLVLSSIIDCASFYTVVSPSLLDDVERFVGKKINKAIIIPNALDLIFEEPINNIQSDPENKFIFINVASLDEKKGHDILIKAFNKAFSEEKEFILYICGDGFLKDKLIKLRDELGLKNNIIFTGNKTKYEIKELLDQSHAFVLSSLVETFGVVVIEALSRGCPVIATICGGPEFLIDENCGILIEPDNIDQLAVALKKMIADYKKYNRQFIRENALNKYGSKTFLNTLSPIYKSF